MTANGTVAFPVGISAPKAIDPIGADIPLQSHGTSFEVMSMGAVSTQSLTIDDSIKVFPNPTSGQLTVFTGTHTADRISVHTISGHWLLEHRPTGTSTLLDLDHLPAGVYMVHVVSGHRVSAYKVVRR